MYLVQPQEKPALMTEPRVTDPLRTDVARHLQDRIEEMVDALSSAVFARVAPFQRLAGPGQVDGFRADLRRTCAAYIGTVADRRALTRAELDDLRRIGENRARQGIDADAVSDGHEVAMATLWSFVRDGLGEADDVRTATATMSELAMEGYRTLKAAVTALTTGHAAERARGTYLRTRATAELVAKLLDGAGEDPRDLDRAAREMGIELSPDWAVILLAHAERDPGAADPDLESVAQALAEALPDSLVGGPRPHPVLHVPILVPGQAGTATLDMPEPVRRLVVSAGALLLVGEEAHPAAALPTEYRRLADEIVCARAAVHGSAVVPGRDSHVYAALRAIPLATRLEFVRTVLGPVLDLAPAKRREALTTLDAYFRAAGRLDDAAGALGLHRNSFRYRLDRVESLLHASFRRGGDRFRIEVALALRALGEEEAALLDE